MSVTIGTGSADYRSDCPNKTAACKVKELHNDLGNLLSCLPKHVSLEAQVIKEPVKAVVLERSTENPQSDCTGRIFECQDLALHIFSFLSADTPLEIENYSNALSTVLSRPLIIDRLKNGSFKMNPYFLKAVACKVIESFSTHSNLNTEILRTEHAVLGKVLSWSEHLNDKMLTELEKRLSTVKQIVAIKLGDSRLLELVSEVNEARIKLNQARVALEQGDFIFAPAEVQLCMNKYSAACERLSSYTSSIEEYNQKIVNMMRI